MTIKYNDNQTVLSAEREKEIYASLEKTSLDSSQYLNLLEELRESRIYHGETVLSYIYNLSIFQEKIIPAQVAHIDERLSVEPTIVSNQLMPELIDISKIIIENEMEHEITNQFRRSTQSSNP